jgi:hypothetical protein
VGLRFGSGPAVPKARASASAGRKLAYRPHMPTMWDRGGKCTPRSAESRDVHLALPRRESFLHRGA